MAARDEGFYTGFDVVWKVEMAVMVLLSDGLEPGLIGACQIAPPFLVSRYHRSTVVTLSARSDDLFFSRVVRLVKSVTLNS